MKEYYNYKLEFRGSGSLTAPLEAFTLAQAVKDVLEKEHTLLCRDEVVRVTIQKEKL